VRLSSALALAAALTAIPLPLCAQALPDDFIVTLERDGTSCGGPCPSYSVRINARGDVTYRGTMFVRVEGAATDRIPVPQVGALLSTIERIGFFDLRDSYIFGRASAISQICALRRRSRCDSAAPRNGHRSERLAW